MGTRSLAQSPQLDEGLWTKIGQHMTIKEWAKASGACPAAWGAQCMWSLDITTNLPVAGILFCNDDSNKTLQFMLQKAKRCIGDCRRQQEALPLMLSMDSCALHGPQPLDMKLLDCPCRMAVPVQEMLTEYCSSAGPHSEKRRKHTQSPQWHGPPPRAALSY